VDAFLAVASKREVRRYADRPIAAETERRILEAGRVAGSSKNRQPWRFVLVESAERRERLAEAVYEPGNVRGAQLVVAIVGRPGLDAGRCVQNMLLAAWNEGVGSCPNGLKAPEDAQRALALDADDEIAIVLTFGYPAQERDPSRHTPEEWSDRANRKPLDELVERV